ncbi:MAG: hypothetical protein KA251_02265 [Saprospiraceae bacterium]|nr:hypothetical protein [Candidatus Vicinibacter affinis]MBK7798311.1 hypothetical protein [Candidatus Vicinibacter affinis]MBP6521779.1 hypothetical protein [Saprospiraceae bacterium]HQX43543.1 hypothetical protein [Saprospiraceae bacterium]
MKTFFPNLYFALLFLITSCDGCKDPDECPDRFHIPAEIIPYKAEYHIGDTISFVSKFRYYVHEIRTDKDYNLKNINFNPNTLINYLDTIGSSKITNYFTMIVENNNYKEFIFSGGSSELDGQYELNNDTFSLRFKLIPRKIGNFLLIQKCGIGPNFGDSDFPGRCTGIGYDVIVRMNEGKDGNIEILKTSKDSLYSKLFLLNPENNFYNKGGFCFRVVP